MKAYNQQITFLAYASWVSIFMDYFQISLLVLTLSWRWPSSYRNQSIDLLQTGFYMITASAMKQLKEFKWINLYST